MLSKLIPVAFLAIGTGSGMAAAYFLAPADPTGTDAAVEQSDKDSGKPKAKKAGTAKSDKGSDAEYVKLNNQFVVPVIEDAQVASLVVLSLSLETDYGLREAVYEREPKLRDALLRVLFDHANMGGFSGSFTESQTMELLRTALREAAQIEIGPEVRNVLIGSISRQDT